MNALRTHGFPQGLYAISATKRLPVGTVRWDSDGAYRYCRAGATALSAGNLGLAAAADAAHVTEVLAAAIAKGQTHLSLTVTAGTALGEDQLAGGLFCVETGTGAGGQYPIIGNSVLSSSGTTLSVTLATPLRVALDTTTYIGLMHNPGMNVIESATAEAGVAGVPLVDVTATYYYWAKFKGLANVLIYGTPAVGSNLIASTDLAGGVAVIASSVDVDCPIVGVKVGWAGVNGTYGPVMLNIA